MKAAEKAQIAEAPFRSFFLRYPNIMNSVELALILIAGIAMMVLIPRVGPILDTCRLDGRGGWIDRYYVVLVH